MPERIGVDAARHAETKPLVKRRCLEVVGFERDLMTASGSCFAFDHGHETGAVALATQMRWHKQVADVAGAAPGPAKQATEGRAVSLAQEHPQQLAVGNARAGLVEGVDLLLEETNVLRLGLFFNGEVHAAGCGNSLLPANQRGPASVLLRHPA